MYSVNEVCLLDVLFEFLNFSFPDFPHIGFSLVPLSCLELFYLFLFIVGVFIEVKLGAWIWRRRERGKDLLLAYKASML